MNDWVRRLVPIVALGKEKYVENDHENAAERALNTKKRWQQGIELAELKTAEKKKRVHESGVQIAKIEFQRANFEQHLEGLEIASVAR